MQQAMYQAAILTFEELVFMFPIARIEKNKVKTDESVRVSVKFNGIFSGQLVLQVENKILPLLASNMLGDDEPLADEILYDVLGELANVITGNTLPAIAGKNEIFHLDAPEILDTFTLLEQPTATAGLYLEESEVDVLLFIK